jgi:hypothetical protein
MSSPDWSTFSRALWLLTLLLREWGALAGIPEPGIVLYGVGQDSARRRLTSGSLEIVYSDPVGRSVTNTVELQAFGEYSYVTEIPFESAVPGQTNITGDRDMPTSGVQPINLTRSAWW